MSNFNRNNRQNFGSRNSDRQMFKATCAKCGKSCEVPFRPNGRKPVLCSECFEQSGGGAARRYEDLNTRRSGFGGRRNSRGRETFEAVCDKCGKTCTLPFRPTKGKPIYCSECFEEKNSSRNAGAQKSQIREEVKAMNKKLDMILELLSSAKKGKVEEKTEKTEEKVEEKKDIKKEKEVKPKEKKKTVKKKVVKNKVAKK